MMVSVALKYIFYAIPRTGSRAVSLWLESSYQGTPATKRWGRKYGHHARLVPEDFSLEGFFQFAIVRHPLDRLISLYHAWDGIDPSLSFADFVRRYVEHKLRDPNPNSKRYRRRPWIGYLGQWAFIKEVPAELYLIRYENLSEKLSGLPFVNGPVILPTIEPSSRMPFDSYYNDPEIRQLALQVTEEDRKWLKYNDAFN